MSNIDTAMHILFMKKKSLPSYLNGPDPIWYIYSQTCLCGHLY